MYVSILYTLYSDCVLVFAFPFLISVMKKKKKKKKKTEDHWSCIAHLIAEDMLKSAVIEERRLNIAPGQGQTTH